MQKGINKVLMKALKARAASKPARDEQRFRAKLATKLVWGDRVNGVLGLNQHPYVRPAETLIDVVCVIPKDSKLEVVQKAVDFCFKIVAPLGIILAPSRREKDGSGKITIKHSMDKFSNVTSDINHEGQLSYAGNGVGAHSGDVGAESVRRGLCAVATTPTVVGAAVRLDARVRS